MQYQPHLSLRVVISRLRRMYCTLLQSPSHRLSNTALFIEYNELSPVHHTTPELPICPQVVRMLKRTEAAALPSTLERFDEQLTTGYLPPIHHPHPDPDILSRALIRVVVFTLLWRYYYHFTCLLLWRYYYPSVRALFDMLTTH